MDFWIFCAVVCIAGIISKTYQARLKANVKLAEASEQTNGLTERLARIDERLAALETLVIEREKQDKFDRIP